MRLSMRGVYRSHDLSKALLQNATPPYGNQVNICVKTRAAKISRGVVSLEGPQKFAAEISTDRRSLPVLEFKLRLDGPGRSFFRLRFRAGRDLFL